MPTKTLLIITAFLLSMSAAVFAQPMENKRQSVETSLSGDTRWKNNNQQSAESILRHRQRPGERQHMKKPYNHPTSKYPKQHYRSPAYYERQRLKEKYQNNPPIR